MYTAVLDISYFGAPFCGFARQPEQLTVQGNLEECLRKVFNKEILTTCAGRTDSGVHALHQYVSFELEEDDLNCIGNSSDRLKLSLEKLSHDDIHINSTKILDYAFSARHDARLRKYSYFIANQSNPPLFMRDFSWHIPKELDIDLMQESSTFLIGEHDFKSFCVAASSKGITTVRNISEINFKKYKIYETNIIEIQVSGNAFLHSMVRTLVGTFVKVGLGKRDTNWVKEVLEAKNRQSAGECAPAKGLVFMDVLY